MTLDDFFGDTKKAWEELQKQRAEEAKQKEAQERQRKIDELKARREGRKATATKITPEQNTTGQPFTAHSFSSFHIESLSDRYRLHNVHYNIGGPYIVDWSKELLDGGKYHTSLGWISLTLNTPWKIPNLQLYHATLTALYIHEETCQEYSPDHPQKILLDELHHVFKECFAPEEKYMPTSTRIKYTAHGQDEIIHDFGYPTVRKRTVSLVGLDRGIDRSCKLENQMNALLGSTDLAEIEKVYEWISGMKPYLRRYPTSPAQDVERTAVLGITLANQFAIDCYALGDFGYSRGVYVHPK